jgi:SAM-dependent methyltransferase
MEKSRIRKYVRDRYAGIARDGGSCCAPKSSCCAESAAESLSRKIGYSEEEMNVVPEGANLGLGCGNPIALASLKEGETVLDLGSGAGFDCFLAARAVGPKGRVIGVDMTPEMIDKSRENARKSGFGNVEFRLGEIEHLPAADNSVDAVISNCVINLSTAKDKVFAEAYRVLKPGGRVMISDLVLSRELPEPVAGSLAAYAGCISGAVMKDAYLRMIEAAGFRDVGIAEETSFSIGEGSTDAQVKSIADAFHVPVDDVRDAAGTILSIRVSGKKPGSDSASENPCCRTGGEETASGCCS